jgi:hypothetical protein
VNLNALILTSNNTYLNSKGRIAQKINLFKIFGIDMVSHKFLDIKLIHNRDIRKVRKRQHQYPEFGHTQGEIYTTKRGLRELKETQRQGEDLVNLWTSLIKKTNSIVEILISCSNFIWIFYILKISVKSGKHGTRSPCLAH